MAKMNFLDVFVTVIVAIALYEPLTTFVDGVNATGIASTLLNLVPLLYIIAVVAVIAFELKRKT